MKTSKNLLTKLLGPIWAFFTKIYVCTVKTPISNAKISSNPNPIYKHNSTKSSTPRTACCIWGPKAKIDYLVLNVKLLLININYVEFLFKKKFY